MRLSAQAKAIRQEQIAHLQLHISPRSTHMLLEGGSGPLDSDDLYGPLSKAQREKAREQAECAKMYMHMLDLFSPDLPRRLGSGGAI